MFTQHIYRYVFCILFVLSLSLALSATESQLSGREIMEKVDQRDDGENRTSTMTMTLTNKRGRQRIRELESVSQDIGEDTKKMMLFQKPADVQGTGFLTWEYDATEKEDDRWLYMPALRKVRRITGSSNDDYFMGSDFTYDDLGERNLDEDTHRFLREETLDGVDCWVVESQPVDPEDPYEKVISWVRKDYLMKVKVEFYNKVGLLKTLQFSDFQKIDGIWTAHQLFMDNRQEEHQTVIKFANVRYNQSLDDQIFTVANLKRGKVR